MVLVLVAIYRSELNRLLPADTPLNRNTLATLLARTVAEASASSSPVLEVDAKILQAIQIRFGLCCEQGVGFA